MNTANRSPEPMAVVWFRRDLRLVDQVALSQGLEWAASTGGRLLPLFVFDTEILGRLQDRDDARVGFLHKCVSDMDRVLQKVGSRMVVRVGRPLEVLKQLKAEHPQVKVVFCNRDFEPYALKRDTEVGEWASSVGVEFRTHRDQVIFEPHEVQKDAGGPYTVFTPYSRKWRALLLASRSDRLEEAPVQLSAARFVREQALSSQDRQIPDLESIGFRVSPIAIPATTVRNELLIHYADRRNLPALDATTRLGVHLRFGTVSIRRLARAAVELKADVWLSELIWREFFMSILAHFPHVTDRAFRAEYDRIEWRNSDEDFESWCAGRTGYPLVDAGMRELDQTGFMHNRVRMVAGSFLVKHLLIDWRRGEAHFARKLLDFDLSANNGNWQWVAGTGCDAAPYFRVFNPSEQIKKFDSKMEYIKRWVPEFGSSRYPEPMVDHRFARQRALDVYKRALKAD